LDLDRHSTNVADPEHFGVDPLILAGD
jgi:hypothetical protein